MRILFDLFLDICLFRKGPQDLPSSWILLGLSIVAYAIASLAILLVSMGFRGALSQTVLDITLLTGLTYGVLVALGYPLRFAQTLTALAGTGTLLSLIAWPLVIWMDRTVAADAVPGLPSLLFLVLLGWSIAVMAHVLRHALSTTLSMGLMYALGYLVISIMVAEGLFSQ